MTTEMLNYIMDLVIRSTLFGVCLAIVAIGLVTIWKWIFSIFKACFFYLFPNLEKKLEQKKAEKNAKTKTE
jgi:hypothetical protein